MINISEVIETNKMIEQENFDVRTITMGINLLDCASTDLDELCQNIHNKITRLAKNLVKTGEEISKEFGVPIVNKRISITPISLVGGSACKTTDDYVKIAKTLDQCAKELGVNFLGGYSAIVSKGMSKSDELLIRSIPQAMAQTDFVCSSVNVGSTKTGINMDAVRLMGEIVKDTAEATKDRGSLGCAKLVVLCNAPDDNPFMAGAFHGVSEADAVVSVGVSGPGVVKYALEKVKGESFEVLCETIKRTAFKITRVGQLVAKEASRRLNVPFGIIDLSLAPTPAIGDSVADILELIGLEHAGAPGTTAALALLNDQVKKGGIMASSYVGGLSGAFIPVSEDQGMINAVEAGALTIEKLEAMTCVCSVGLDMITIPGDTPATTISGVIADEAAIGMVNQKTTAVRIIPVVGMKVGDNVDFGGLLGHAPIMPVNPFCCEAFVNRAGRIPAPIHSFKN
ncbi:PFL family protein [Prevotella copri]|uniref:UPF0210 protein FYJ72_09610 n=1 Tax=Segatella copri TaxID=165179 RepID=A0A6I2U089_9BACT|nr:PFL family protein [Segatella copri]MST77928.1 PFL family protein [Segatella copri]